MIESKIEIIKRYIRAIICKITKHEYGCCSNIFKNCNKCNLI